MSTHGPVLPIWSCGGCGAPWPCATRRRELRAEFADAPVSLALYMGAHLVRATADLTWAPAGTLHRRFLGWTGEADQPTPTVQRSAATVPARPRTDEPKQAG
ncbi:hypothetical protein G3554_13495 [Micromonospora sp. PPF5-17]|uniref:Flavin reductase n=1 Tax=Micromonospora solifontis TaxID=2487138 RepID=A0ABX9WI16_9ACTN|nr:MULTISPECIES: hypothetical protein [Micromonospora]NES15067.1 hypothetical protein [Micromonospora sp. PPF5-17B]NES37167.1 hypothetical protein [Micromonospora solifontis]NES56258.1 hypothetical protein [Micromonospora sp. PPF5-6]RNL98619.1 hypothetical protein EFE23_13535 [Micromonospora solifontis]